LDPTAFAAAEYTLADLLDRGEFGFRLVVAPEGWAERVVTGAHSLESDHPAEWLDRDWVMLTTGVLLPREPREQRRFIAELDEAGVAALGLEVGWAQPETPPAMLDEAEQRGFPVFTIPLETAFRDVLSAVYRATLSKELRSASRLVAIQRFLMDSLGEESPRSTVLQRLAALIETPVAVISDAGEIVDGPREVPAAEIARAIGRLSTASRRFEIEGFHGVAFAINEPSANGVHWLVVAARAGQPLHPLTQAAAQATLPLLTAMARLEERHGAQEAAIRQATLDTLLDVDDRKDAVLATARASAIGMNISDRVQAFVAVDPAGKTDLGGLLPLVVNRFGDPPRGSLATVRDGKLVVLALAPVSDEVIAARLLSEAPNLRVGVGRCATDALGVKDSWGEAELAVRTAGYRDTGSIVRYDDLDFGTVLLNEVPMDHLRPKMERWLAPLRDQPLVVEALHAYLKYDLDVVRTARGLHLHPNSVRYRLSRAEEMLDAKLRSPETLTALHIALLSSDLIEKTLGTRTQARSETDPGHS
jgi:purine catabolism regulator